MELKQVLAFIGLGIIISLIVSGTVLRWHQYVKPQQWLIDTVCPSPLVYWSDPKPNPYQWAPMLIVELGSFSDPDGCRRDRLRQHSTKHKTRWAMYYSLIPDRVEGDLTDMRAVSVNAAPTVFVGKLYADLTTLTDRGAIAEGRIEAQRLLTAEFVWLLRPCEHETPSPYQQYTTGLTAPAHLKDIL